MPLVIVPLWTISSIRFTFQRAHEAVGSWVGTDAVGVETSPAFRPSWRGHCAGGGVGIDVQASTGRIGGDRSDAGNGIGLHERCSIRGISSSHRRRGQDQFGGRLRQTNTFFSPKSTLLESGMQAHGFAALALYEGDDKAVMSLQRLLGDRTRGRRL